jgi:hypothetical protein
LYLRFYIQNVHGFNNEQMKEWREKQEHLIFCTPRTHAPCELESQHSLRRLQIERTDPSLSAVFSGRCHDSSRPIATVTVHFSNAAVLGSRCDTCDVLSVATDTSRNGNIADPTGDRAGTVIARAQQALLLRLFIRYRALLQVRSVCHGCWFGLRRIK